MYKCNNCGSIIREPKRIVTTFEEYYGVSNLFPDSHRLELLVCPNCEENDLEELTQCYECEEWFSEDELEDINGKLICRKCSGSIENDKR